MNDLAIDAVSVAADLATAAGGLFAGDGPRLSPPPDSTDGTVIGPGASPPDAPPPVPDGRGGLGAGATGAGEDYTTHTGAAELTDEKLSELVAQIFASNQAARDRILAILNEIRAKQHQIAPELGDPASVIALQQFVELKFAEIGQILTDAQVDAKTQAAILGAIGDEYRSGGPQSDGSGSPGAGSDSGGEPGAADPGATTDVGAAPAGTTATDPLVDPLAGLGPLSGMGMDPLAALAPALAGLGSLPGAASGGGPGLDGLGPALGALGQLSGLAGGFSDRAPADSKPDGGFTDTQADPADDQPDREDPADALHDTSDQQNGSGHRAEDLTSAPEAPTPVQAAPAAGAAPDTPADAGRDVTMPDGSIVTAGDATTASAMRAVLSGSTVTDAFGAVGVELPPPGTPVTAPIDPARLVPGSLGTFDSREPVMAMGDGKIWMDGQLQPIGALGSTSDFLGWSKPPTAAGSPAGQPAAATAPQAAN